MKVETIEQTCGSLRMHSCMVGHALTHMDGKKVGEPIAYLRIGKVRPVSILLNARHADAHYTKTKKISPNFATVYNTTTHKKWVQQN